MPYQPEPLPIRDLVLDELLVPLGRANRALARFDGLLQSLPNPEVLLSPMVDREAVLSSRIEGTQATVEEIVGHEAGLDFDQDKVDDIDEVLNYRQALRAGSRENPEHPLRLGLILQLHQMLLAGVRGHDEAPGQFRIDQNWIGPPGSRIEDATFVPPSPLQLRDHLEAFERYLQQDDRDALIQCAVMHAQFELLHPFKDGNGRIGRVLIPLLLFRKEALSSPTFYLSSYLERHRQEYCDRLQAISDRRDWQGWILFFLGAIEQQANDNIDRVRRIRDLYQETVGIVREKTRSQYTHLFTDEIFKTPGFQVARLAANSGIPLQTAHTMVRQLTEGDGALIRNMRPGAGRRPALYWFPDLIMIADGLERPRRNSPAVP
jgi:Fic family protein